MLEWNPLTTSAQLESLEQESFKHPVLIFKHSTRCNVSSISKMRLENQWVTAALRYKPYFLDIFANRALSDEVVSRYGVQHESPQVLILNEGKCIYHASHFDIDPGHLSHLSSHKQMQ